MSGECVSIPLADEPLSEIAPGLALGDPVWSDVAYERDAVVEIGAEAACWVIYGEFWDYREGGFYVTELFCDRRRRLVEDPRRVPPGPWRHLASCACEVCRLGTA